MATVLIIDDTAFWRDLCVDALRLNGYSASAAEDGVDALPILQKEQVDLIVLDLQLPHLPGLKLLERLRRIERLAQLPVIVLTGKLDKEHVVAARSLGVTDYLLKGTFSLSGFLERVQRCLAASPSRAPSVAAGALPACQPMRSPVEASVHTPLLTREQSLERAMTALDSRTLSGVVAEVLQTAASPTLEMADLATLVGRDPLLTAKVLQAANRLSQAAHRGPIITLHDAVRVVGSVAIRDIAAMIGIFEAMPPADPDGFNPVLCWQHSIAVASLSARLAPEGLGNAAYLVGLCHDLGEILFRTHFGAEYRRVLELHSLGQHTLGELERELLGTTRQEVGRIVLHQLGLPDAIQRPILAYQTATLRSESPNDAASRLLQAADAYAAGLLLTSAPHAPVRPLSRVLCRDATGHEHPIAPDRTNFCSQIRSMTMHYLQLTAKDQSAIHVPLARGSNRVWLAREPSFSEFDPIACALAGVASLEVHHRLPTAAEMQQFEVVVVLDRNGSTDGFRLADAAACASGRGAVPVLHLSQKSDAASATPGMLTNRSWPIPLNALAEFVNHRPASDSNPRPTKPERTAA